MYTALKEYTMEFVIFEGVHKSDYPMWFKKKVLPYCMEDADRYPIMIDSPFWPEGQDLSLTEGWDVFIQNDSGDVRRIEYSTFHTYFYEITDGYCCLKDNALQYTIYEGYGGSVPDWLSVNLRTIDPMDIHSEIMMHMDYETEDNCVVILLNRHNDTHYIGIDKFEEFYISNQFNPNNWRRKFYVPEQEDFLDIPYHYDVKFNGIKTEYIEDGDPLWEDLPF